MRSSLSTEDSFVRNAAYMITGSGAGILIQLLAAPIIARIYQNTDVYGLFGVFSVYTNTLGGMAMLGYNMAFVLPSDERGFIRVLKLSIWIAALWCLLVSLVFIVGGQPLGSVLQMDGLGIWLYMIGPVAFLVAIDRILNDWSVRQRQFRQATIYGTTNMFANKGFNIVYGKYVSNHVDGLLWTHLLNYVLNPFLSAVFVVKNFRKTLLTKVSAAELKATAIEYVHYPRFFFWGSSVQVLSASLPSVLLPVLGYGLGAAALFNWAIMVLELPLRMMGSGVSSVFLNKSAEIVRQRPEELAHHSRKLFKAMLVLTSVSMSILYVLGEPLFAFMLGNTWREAGTIASILSLYYFFRLLSVPLSVLFGVLRREREFFYYHMLIFGVRILSLVAGAAYTDDLFALMTWFSIANAAVYVVFTLRVLVLSGIAFRSALSMLMVWTTGTFAVCALLKWMIFSTWF
ncbi:MAG: hypothetical protein JNM00_15570 [Flavobacteriales bacterium]|nr:hypothetical protein [Flavobacteriales bacterium]